MDIFMKFRTIKNDGNVFMDIFMKFRTIKNAAL